MVNSFVLNVSSTVCGIIQCQNAIDSNNHWCEGPNNTFPMGPKHVFLPAFNYHPQQGPQQGPCRAPIQGPPLYCFNHATRPHSPYYQ